MANELTTELLDKLLARPTEPPRRQKGRKADGEAVVLRACLRVLADHPAVAYFERRNTGAVQFADGGFMRFGRPGAADIFAVLRDGRHIEIECKRADGKGKLSPVQARFAAIMRDLGIPYRVVISGAELQEWLCSI